MIPILAILAAANPVPIVAARDLARARDRWLQAVMLTGAFATLMMGEVWVALLAVWCVLMWKDASFQPMLIIFGGIVAMWFLLRQMPAWAWLVIPWAWLAIAEMQAIVSVRQSIKADWSFMKRPSLGR